MLLEVVWPAVFSDKTLFSAAAEFTDNMGENVVSVKQSTTTKIENLCIETFNPFLERSVNKLMCMVFLKNSHNLLCSNFCLM
ncbi:hypothetical protein MmazTMA_26990 [Methanosarcina mazei]|nr:hypothetical protein MmazTMA_26990 [Methanosarcina mazei]